MGGDADSATAHYERAMQLFRDRGLTHAEAERPPAWRMSIGERGVWTKASTDVPCVRRSGGRRRRRGPRDARGAARPVPVLRGSYREAAERTELALTLAEGLRLPRVFSEALNTKSLILDRRRSGEAYLLLQHSLEVALDNDLGASALRAYNNLCAFMNRSGRHEEELRAAQDGLDSLVGSAISPGRRSCSHATSRRWIHGSMGRRARPRRRVRAHPEFTRSPQLINECASLIHVHVSRGELDEARELQR